jgi:Domain of unknown function (DUF305)
MSRASVLRGLLSIAATACLAANALAANSSVPSGAALPEVEISEESAFLSQNNAVMDKMMADMEIKPSGDVDRDFVNMMVPHHQGAIDMAQAVLRYGRNEQIRRLAQEIIVTQQQEISAMRFAIGDPLPPSAPAATQVQPGLTAKQMGGALGVPNESASHHDMHVKGD